MVRRALPWLFVASAVVQTGSARANPMDAFGFGSRETAMGGAASASVRGVSSGYYNPAALTRSTGLELSVGYFRAHHDLAINGKDSNVDPVSGFSGGVVLPGTLVGIPFAFGLALHLPDARVSRVRALRQEQPRWELYDNRNQRLFLAANLAIRPVRWLSLGGGLSFMSSTRGRLDITGNANIFNPDDSRLRHEVDADLTATRYPQAGARVELSDRVALAAVYRGEFQLRLDLDAHIAGDISGLTTALYDLRTRSVNNFLPQQAVVGGAFGVSHDVLLSLDATWIDWSSYVAPVAQLDVVLDVPPPPGGWPSTITPPETPAKARVVPLRMEDRVSPRLGVEWRALARAHLDGFLRGGYELAISPIAPQRGATSYVDRDRHTLSLGVGVTLRDLARELPAAVSVDAHLQWSELVEGTTSKTDPSDFVGDYRASGRIVAAGTTVTLVFDAPRDDRDGRKEGP